MIAIEIAEARELMDQNNILQALKAQPGGMNDLFDVEVHLVAWGPMGSTLFTGLASILVVGFAPRTLGFSALGMVGVGLFAWGLVRTVRTWRSGSFSASRGDLISGGKAPRRAEQ